MLLQKKILAHCNPKNDIVIYKLPVFYLSHQSLSSSVGRAFNFGPGDRKFDPPVRQGNSFKFQFKFFIKCRET